MEKKRSAAPPAGATAEPAQGGLRPPPRRPLAAAVRAPAPAAARPPRPPRGVVLRQLSDEEKERSAPPPWPKPGFPIAEARRMADQDAERRAREEKRSSRPSVLPPKSARLRRAPQGRQPIWAKEARRTGSDPPPGHRQAGRSCAQRSARRRLENEEEEEKRQQEDQQQAGARQQAAHGQEALASERRRGKLGRHPCAVRRR